MLVSHRTLGAALTLSSPGKKPTSSKPISGRCKAALYPKTFGIRTKSCKVMVDAALR